MAAITFGFAGAVFYSALVASLLSDQPDQAGTIHAVVSMIGLFGVAFPTLVGAVADSFGLTAGLGVYAIIGPLILALLLVVDPPPRSPPANLRLTRASNARPGKRHDVGKVTP